MNESEYQIYLNAIKALLKSRGKKDVAELVQGVRCFIDGNYFDDDGIDYRSIATFFVPVDRYYEFTGEIRDLLKEVAIDATTALPDEESERNVVDIEILIDSKTLCATMDETTSPAKFKIELRAEKRKTADGTECKAQPRSTAQSRTATI